MKKLLPTAVLLALAASPVYPQASANLAAGKTQPSPLAPSEIVTKAPQGDWTAIPASDLLVMDLAPDAKGKPRRVVIQLMPPPFSQGWIGNIRKLAAAHWWDGLSINRVQDNYVVQWGDANAEDKAKAKALPAGLVTVPESGYQRRLLDDVTPGFIEALEINHRSGDVPVVVERDAYSKAGFSYHFAGWPIATDRKSYWPVHCYGMVGVGRDLSPNTGSGAELYVVIGHAPRHLDRNIALVGRVIEGIEHLSSLPRGTGGLGFYETPEERTGIVAIRLGLEVPGLPAYEYLSTESQSFARYADARANRRDAFFIKPAGGADICNIPVPVRRTK
ncbi:MAG: peptidylprolyl isomerase [Novosphingobium sp.]